MSWLRSKAGDGFWRGLRGRPSTWLLGLAVLLFMLQVFPGTGIFLMLVGAGLWTGLLLAAFIVAICIEALLGYLPRIWVLLPVASVASYYVAAGMQRTELARLEAQWAEQNGEAVAAFDPATDSVLLDFQSATLNDRRDGAALLHLSGLPTVYIAKQGDAGVERLDQVPAGGCEGSADWVVRPGRFGIPGVAVPLNFCLTEAAQLPDGRLLTVTRQVDRKNQWNGSLVVRRLAISENDRQLGSFATGEAEVMGWIPVVAIGCGLVSQPPGWHCAAGIVNRENVVIEAAPAGHHGEHPIATMLGFEPEAISRD